MWIKQEPQHTVLNHLLNTPPRSEACYSHKEQENIKMSSIHRRFTEIISNNSLSLYTKLLYGRWLVSVGDKCHFSFIPRGSWNIKLSKQRLFCFGFECSNLPGPLNYPRWATVPLKFCFFIWNLAKLMKWWDLSLSLTARPFCTIAAGEEKHSGLLVIL